MNNVFIFGTAILTSLYYFPFVASALPITNTKSILALLGVIMLFINNAKGQNAQFNKRFLIVTCSAVSVTIISIASATFHGTPGSDYHTFFISMWIWLGAAYLVCCCIRKVHSEISIHLFGNYLIVVCVCQCIIALLNQQFPIIKSFVDSLIQSEGFMGKAEGRIYGIGCALDVAGIKMSGVLIMIAVFVKQELNKKYITLYLLAFFIISTIGNMISRTTIVGVILSLLYWIITIKQGKLTKEFTKRFFSILCLGLVLSIVLYNTNERFANDLEFGFEGFFSLWRTGHWETHSNNNLALMVVFPDNWQTWFLGDGYIWQPQILDPYYVGPNYEGFYKNTDIGYLLFIFYFGICGLFFLVMHFIVVAYQCIQADKNNKSIIILALFVNFIVWCKVSTDLFPFFAPFLLIPQFKQKPQQENPIEFQD